MTKEEREAAIEVLKDWDGYFIGHSSDDVNEALEMAIEALKSQEKRITREDIYIALKASPCMYHQNGTWYEETELLQTFDDMYFNEGDEE